MPSSGAIHTHHILVHLSVFPFFFFFFPSLNRLCGDLNTIVWKYYCPSFAYFNIYTMVGISVLGHSL